MYQLYQYDEAVEREFHPRQLIVCASLTTLNGGVLSPVQESIPAGFLFSNRTLEKTSNGHNLLENGDVVAVIEPSNGGCKYRLTEGNVVYCLVQGHPEFDICDIDLKLQVQKVGNSYTISNQSTINGEHWTNADTNQAMANFGFQWAVTGVGNGEYGQLTYLPNGGYVQSGTKTPLVSIGMNGLQDYIVQQSDIDDANDEYITLQLVWRPRGGSWKNASDVLRVQLSQFMEEYK